MKKARKNVMKKVTKFFLSREEESLPNIFKPLKEIEGKVITRQAVLKEKVLQLQDEIDRIDNQIEAYNIEIDKCDMYLDNVNKYT